MELRTKTLPTRRDLLKRSAGGFGAIALQGMLADDMQAEVKTSTDALAPKQPHHQARAKRVIFLYMTGGVSHVDSFDPKPELIAGHGKKITVDNWQGKLGEFTRYLKKPDWQFKPGGQSGIEVSDLFPHVRGVVDDLCVIRSMESNHTNHYESTLGMHCGSWEFARPSIGAWISYGLGTVNSNLPSFVVVAPQAPYAGAQTWGSDFLPGCHQGTQIIPGDNPIPNLRPRVASSKLQELELELLAKANKKHLDERTADAALDARIRSFETAFGMQREAPAAMNLSDETAATLKLYGLQPGQKTGFGWQCLVARRLAERGVRFIQLYSGGGHLEDTWDGHESIEKNHGLHGAEVDQPIAALLTDLEQRGLLESTLVVWGGEFGRMPFSEGRDAPGRNHNPYGFSMWMAGGGVKGGMSFGETDEFGFQAMVDKTHVHDIHATILHLMGIDHEDLSYFHQGRQETLTDVHGRVIREICA